MRFLAASLTLCALFSCGDDETPGRSPEVSPPAITPAPTITPPIADAAPPSDLEDMNVAQTLPDVIAFHPVRLDATQKLLPAFDGSHPFPKLAELTWKALKRTPVLDNGYRTYLTHSIFRGDPGHELDVIPGDRYPHNRAGLAAMWVDSALAYWVYSGDAEVIALAKEFLDFVLANGMTLESDAWASVGYASANGHEVKAHGATNVCSWDPLCGAGDGDGFIETDKVAELGFGFLRFYEHDGDARYLDAAVAAARALAKHVRTGDETRSPWPFRVDAATGKHIIAEYTANMLPAIRLFDELARIGKSEAGFTEARQKAWDWLIAYPVKNEAWSGYFEDIPTADSTTANLTQYMPLELARWFMTERGAEGVESAKPLIEFARRTFANESSSQSGPVWQSIQWGAEAVSEQYACMQKMGSHTSRFASVLALVYERTGDPSARARAFRSLNWATYLASDRGVVKDTALPVEVTVGGWFSDGYGDYIRHFMAAIASVPAWAPGDQNHVLRTASVARSVRYTDDAIEYATFDATSDDVLRLRKAPAEIRVGATVLPATGHTVESLPSGGVVVRIHRTGAATGNVRVLLSK
jgi:hypothetical protein